ncbi:MAG: nucleotide-binding protein [Variovorax sp.]|nr:nucleotide-binding protein [Variovorax sp.]
MSDKALVIDANILIRAVLGRRVRELLFMHAAAVRFHAPDVAYADARRYLPDLLVKRGVDPTSAMAVLDQLEIIVRPMDAELYGTVKADALRRIESRDADDWPVLASAMLLDCPVWTEDADFFGTGVATWTTDRVGLYLTAGSNGD